MKISAVPPIPAVNGYVDDVKNIAVGVDLDQEVLDWGQTHNVRQLKESERNRITLLNDDVLTVKTQPMDTVLAMNFSYQIFKTRVELKGYFESVL